MPQFRVRTPEAMLHAPISIGRNTLTVTRASSQSELGARATARGAAVDEGHAGGTPHTPQAEPTTHPNNI
eukprot:6260711-Alexandrium_andersonii.AAC.1